MSITRIISGAVATWVVCNVVVGTAIYIKRNRDHKHNMRVLKDIGENVAKFNERVKSGEFTSSIIAQSRNNSILTMNLATLQVRAEGLNNATVNAHLMIAESLIEDYKKTGEFAIAEQANAEMKSAADLL